MTGFQLHVDAAEGDARTGRWVTPRGEVRTPGFMPVGTRGAIVHLDANDYEAFDDRIRPDVVLANTYHLACRPGADTVEALGGLHRFTTWDGHILTDSGGFQAMSLEPKIDDDGMTFKSTYDGDLMRFTPEVAVRLQTQLGADVQMVLDVCPPLPSSDDVVRTALERTHAWLARAVDAKEAEERPDQALFGIVQGGVDPQLRTESAQTVASFGLPGSGIGGLSVGEPLDQMLVALDATTPHLPADRPRYLMGVGDPASLVEAVARGVDLFDCVLPTRHARHGTVLTSTGKLNLRNARWATDDAPIDPAGTHPAVGRFSLGYLRHLHMTKEPTAGRIVTLHNLWFLLDLMARMREAIAAGTFEALRREVMAVWGPNPA